jgi:hypothetical protein
MELTVEVHLERTSEALLTVHYAVENRSDRPVFLLDELVLPRPDGWLPLGRELIVREADDVDTVRLIRGLVFADASVFASLTVAARPLAPGARLEGVGETALPLAARHPQDPPRRLRGDRPRSFAVLEVGAVEAGDSDLVRLVRVGGGELSTLGVAALARQTLVRSARIALPG